MTRLKFSRQCIKTPHQPEFNSVRKNLFMASEVRSGSTFIAESIAYYLNQRFGHEFWQLAKEPFSDLTWQTSVDQLASTALNLYLDRSGYACAKVMCKSLSIMHKAAADSQDVRDIFFGPNSLWIVVRRRDKLRQAISLATAQKTGLYHFYGNPADAPDTNVSLKPTEIEASLKAIILSDLYLETFAKSLPQNQCVSLFYEDFLVDNGKYLNAINELCSFPFDSDLKAETNFAKIKPTNQKNKGEAYDEFSEWLLKNYD